MRTNPYLNRMPVREPERFYGRQRELRRILTGLEADPPQSFSVVGDRRIGKSSLLHQIRHPNVLARCRPGSTVPPSKLPDVLRNPDVFAAGKPDYAPSPIRVRYHDFQAGVPADEAAFVSFLCGEAAAAGDAPRPESPCRETLTDMLRALDGRSLRLALLWDEFEVVTRHRAIGPDLYAFLRSLAQNHGVAFVVASGRDLRTMCHSAQVADSPFFNVFRTIRLRPLSRDDAVALVREPSAAAGLPLEPFTHLAIDHLGGTFPFFLQIACGALFEHMDEEDTDQPDVREVEDRFIEEAEPHFRYVWEERLSVEERAVMAEAARGRMIGTTSRRTAERLEREGYLARQGDQYVPFSRCFARFVRETFDDVEVDADRGRVAIELGATRADASRPPPRPGMPREAPAAAGRRAGAPGPPGPGSVLLGKYEILSKIGEGGMGKVFLANHVHLARRVVVKLLGPQVASYPDMVTRFRREAMAASAIGHPCVVQVHDFDWYEDGRPFIVMEYLEGQDLFARIYGEDGRARRRLPAGEAVAVVCAACDALAEAHDRGIVHRDLKPSNIFLARGPSVSTPGPHGYLVKVLDFGISKIASGPTQLLTRASSMLGTPCYMAPEQIVDASTAGPPADQYALGVVLYEALTASLPFEPGVALSRPFWPAPPPPPPPPSARNPEIGAPLDELVLRTLAFKPEERFPGVRDLAAALRELGAG